ncbi:glycosyltransferase [Gordonia sinesedis]
MPKVSVCIPTMNSERTIRATMESVLSQDFTDFDVVVTDNGSSDRTLEIVRSFGDERIKVHAHSERIPMAENWTRAVRNSTGELVKLVCSDDLIASTCLTTQAEIMVQPDVAVVGSRYDVIDDDGVYLDKGLGLKNMCGRVDSASAMRQLVRHLPDELCPTAGILFRRSHFDSTPGFQGEFGYTFDTSLWLEFTENGAFVGCPESLAVSRASTFNVSSATSTLDKIKDLFRYKHRAYECYGGGRGPLRAADLLVADARVVYMLARRAFIVARSMIGRHVG